MRAVVFDSFGGPEVLRVAEIAEPHAGPGEIRVTVKAAGVNALDWKIRSGWAPFPVEFPFVGGLEFDIVDNGTRFTHVEHGVFFDEFTADAPRREEGSRGLLDRLGAHLSQ